MFKKIVTENLHGDPDTFVGKPGDLTIDSSNRIKVHDGTSENGLGSTNPSLRVVRKFTGSPAELDSADPTMPINVTNDGGATLYSADGIWIDSENSNQSGGTMTTLEYEVAGIVNSFGMTNAYQLTDLSFPELAVVGGNFNPRRLFSLETLDIPSLAVVGGECSMYNMFSLQDFSAPSLMSVGGLFGFSDSEASVISLPLLHDTRFGFYIYDHPLCTSFSAPSLTDVGENFGMAYLPKLTGTLSLPALTYVENELTISYMYSLNKISLPSLTYVGSEFYIYDNPVLQSIDVPLLEQIGNGFYLYNMNTLTSVSFPSLESVWRFDPHDMDSLRTLSFPALTDVGNYFKPNDLPSLTTVAVPALETIESGLYMSNLDSLRTLSMPSLNFVGNNFGPYNLPALSSMSLPALETVTGKFNTYGTLPALRSLSINSGLLQINGDFLVPDAALNQRSVDAILVTLAGMDGSNGTTTYDNHTVDLSGGTSAAPSSIGLAAKTTLEGRGNTVTTN